MQTKKKIMNGAAIVFWPAYKPHMKLKVHPIFMETTSEYVCRMLEITNTNKKYAHDIGQCEFEM